MWAKQNVTRAIERSAMPTPEPPASLVGLNPVALGDPVSKPVTATAVYAHAANIARLVLALESANEPARSPKPKQPVSNSKGN